MFRHACLLFAACFTLSGTAQTTEGALFMHLNAPNPFSQNILGYLDYPGGDYHFMDSLAVRDMALSADRLFVAANILKVFDRETGQPVDSITGMQAGRVAVWDNMVLVLTNQMPHFRAYDRQTLNPLFTLDTSKVPFFPQDLAVLDGIAYLTLPDPMFGLPALGRVDLVAQDTMSTVTNAPSFFGGFSHLAVGQDDRIYIQAPWYTAVPRASVFAFDPAIQAYDSIALMQYVIGDHYPVAAGDEVHFFSFNTHYSISGDTFHTSDSDSMRTLAYDSANQLLFIGNRFGDPGHVTRLFNGLPLDSISVPGRVRQALFAQKPDPLAVCDCLPASGSLAVYPNPAHDQLNLYMPAALEESWSFTVLDVQGRTVRSAAAIATSLHQLSLAGLETGLYIIQWRLGDVHGQKKVVVR
ncbi:MAG: T9SS type A sorting domain-containing protein [Bacteroidota bacterium]